MTIQIISNDRLSHFNNSGYVISPLRSPKSLDEFDLNIVDLSTESLWRNRSKNYSSINDISDYISLRQMAERKTTSAVLFVYPQNQYFLYNHNAHIQHDYGYQQKKPIKDCLSSIVDIISKALPFATYGFPIIYENTTTTLNGMTYNASFYFEDLFTQVTKSDRSNKTTTVNYNDLAFLTTLQILESPEKLTGFVETILPLAKHEEAPQWAKEIMVLNDVDLMRRIVDANKTIRQMETTILAAENNLRENARIKSILYTNGDELVEVVFSILEKILACDLSEFVDEKKEDFLIKKDEYTIIGEIKGVTSNIKSEHISQVDVHYHGYLDKLAEESKCENVYQVLIMNPFRNKPLSERDPVHDTQILLAERNGCLIIETVTLLKLYEKLIAGEIDVTTCEKLFTEKSGILKESDF